MDVEVRFKEFIEKSNRIHNFKYDYSKVKYSNNCTKVCIICPTHGEFYQIPNSHSRGGGCDKCRIDGKRSTKEEFIIKARNVHGNKYNYDKVNYKTALSKVEIICPEHGSFKQTPNKHISRKQGCVKCGKEALSKKTRKSKKVFIEEANIIHNNKYDYSLVDYQTCKIKVKIVCPKHGEFKQSPSKHLSGDGCPICGNESISKKARINPTGWKLENWKNAANRSKNFDSFKVYIIKCWGNEEEFYKIGKTFLTLEKRFNSKITLPYNYKIIKIVEDSVENICILEKKLQKKNKINSYTPKINFHGISECFSSVIL